MKRYELTGGARIGNANATFPFAKLRVTENKLELNAGMIGNLVFAPKDIIAIEAYRQVPVIGEGIKITHRVSSYKAKIIFWTFKNPQTVIAAINKTGFFEQINSEISVEDARIVEQQKQSGFPFKKPFAIGAIILWNLLFVFDLFRFYQNKHSDFLFGAGIRTAFGLALTTVLSILFLEPFRKWVLKEGRELDDSLKLSLYFVAVILGFFTVSFF